MESSRSLLIFSDDLLTSAIHGEGALVWGVGFLQMYKDVPQISCGGPAWVSQMERSDKDVDSLRTLPSFYLLILRCGPMYHPMVLKVKQKITCVGRPLNKKLKI